MRNGTLGWADLTLDNWSQMTLEQWQTMDLNSTGVNYATTYTYDGAGNRLLRNDAASGLTTYSYDPANQLLTTLESAGTTTYSYDGAGNRTKRVEPTTGATTCTWDYQNRMIGLSDPTTGVATNVYNAVGQRMETENTSGTTLFVFDMQNLLLETDGSGNTQVYYTLSTTMAGQFGDLISERFPRASTPHTEFYAFDALGSTDSLVDEGGAVDDKYVYTAFGVLANAPQTTENRHTYVGKFGYQDDFGSGVYYVRARWYEADTGRWLSEDPIWPLICQRKAADHNEFELRLVAPSLELRDDFAFGHEVLRDIHPATLSLQSEAQELHEQFGFAWPKFKIELPTDAKMTVKVASPDGGETIVSESN